MGMFFERRIIDGLLPELNSWLKETFKCDFVDSDIHLYPCYGTEGETLFVRFYCGKERKSPYQYSGFFSLSAYPGNCGIVVSHNLYILPDMRGKGLGNFLQYFKKKIAQEYGFSFMKCTTLSDNETENHLLKKYGWQRVFEFKNNRTNHSCIEWVLNISDRKEK